MKKHPRTLKAQARQKKNYDHRHDVSCDIKVGDIVAIKNSKRINQMEDEAAMNRKVYCCGLPWVKDT